MEILVTEAHTPAALAAVRELGEAGCYVVAAAGRKTAALGLFSRHASEKIFLPDTQSESTYEESLLDLLGGMRHQWGRKPILLACGLRTQALAARHPKQFALECHYLGPGRDELALGEDKRRLEKAAAELGVAMPAELKFDGAEDITELARRTDYPAVLKYWGGEKLGLPPERRVFTAQSSSALAVRYTRMYDVQSPVILQKFIPGDSICVAGVLDADSRPVSLFTYKRVRQHGGVGTFYDSMPPGGVTAAAAGLFSRIGMRGLVMAEFRGDAENFTLIDINTRLWRGFPLSRRSRAGLALSYALAAAGEELPLSTGNGYRTGVRAQDFLADLRAALGGHSGKRGKAVAEVIRAARDKSVFSLIREKGDGKVTRAWLKSIVGR